MLVLRDLGADVGWHLPSRFEEGYGLSGATLRKIAEEGYGLVLTVDCGITAAEEVEEAKRLGLQVIVTDHHRPAETLPQCPIVATRPSEYPFPELCGTGVVYKLAQALEAPGLERHLDLVALATIADVVPLVDENRMLAVAGLKRLALAERPGIAALMRTARVDPAAVDEGAVGFRLAPRINAAGRLCRPEAALELLLTDDPDEAARLAQRLEELNRDRQAVEDRILRAAVDQIESWPQARRAQRGYVVADESWHEGVIGIVASRLVEKYRRPVVLIAGTDGDWKGSGRSIPSFDLHAAPRRVRGAPRAFRRPSSRRRPLDPARPAGCVRGRVRRARRRRAVRGRPRPAARRRRRRPRPRLHARARRRAPQAGALRPRQPGRDAPRRRL